MSDSDNTAHPVDEFLNEACVPLDNWHASGTLQKAEAIRAANPGVATGSVYAAAVLGDESTLRGFIESDALHATRTGGPRNWDALTYLCFSRYLRLDGSRSAAFVGTARALLDAGASANTGWFEREHQPTPEFESALYGACGVAHHAELTRLLLERGADPNDGEVTYHTPETRDNTALHVLVEIGKPNADSLATMLLRKADWHDEEGLVYLLAHGADPNRMTGWGRTALHQSIQRDNALSMVEALLDHGGDPSIPMNGRTAVALAARRGRGDILELFERRSVMTALSGVDRLLAACAREDAPTIRAIAEQEPAAMAALLAEAGARLAEFAGVGNTGGVRHLLDLGVPVTALYVEGDGYYGIARNSQALHVAAWRARHATVKLLIERGAPVNVEDGGGRTPLMLAVACVDSYWSDRRSPDSVRALLEAGAVVRNITLPTGYTPIDDLLAT